jgi:hypothetical protein
MRCLFIRNALFVALAVSCSAGTAPPGIKAEGRILQLEKFGQHFFQSIPDKPIREHITKHKNPMIDDQVDNQIHREYTGFSVSYFVIKPKPDIYLRKLIIWDASIPLPFGLKIGATKQEVIKILGVPTLRKPNKLVYERGDDPWASVAFCFQGNTLSGLEFEYDID